MRDYIIRKVSQQRAVLGSQSVRLENDIEAVSAAQAATCNCNVSRDCHALEVWHDDRMVTRVVCRPEPRTSPQPRETSLPKAQ